MGGVRKRYRTQGNHQVDFGTGEAGTAVRGYTLFLLYCLQKGTVQWNWGTRKEYFDNTAMQCMENRLKHMCDTNLERQEKLIRGTILMGTKRINGQKEERRGGTGMSNRSFLLQENLESHRIMAAEKIADILLKEAIWSEDGREVGWISIMMAGYKEMVSWLGRHCYGADGSDKVCKRML